MFKVFILSVILLCISCIDINSSKTNVEHTERVVSGKLIGDIAAISKIEAVVVDKTNPEKETYMFSLWKDSYNNGYSSFIKLPKKSELTVFSMTVRIYTFGNSITGISETIEFPVSAGNIEVPEFNIWNSIPLLITTDTIVNINDTIQVYVTASDLRGTIVRYEWDIGNTGIFVESENAETTLVAPGAITDDYITIVRVSDNDSNIRLDTIYTKVVEDYPTASNVTISGNPTQNGVLHGSYVYLDLLGDGEGLSTFQWYRNGESIDGATDTSYAIQFLDKGKTLAFGVTPIAISRENNVGDEVRSYETQPITGFNPSEAKNLVISGPKRVDSILTLDYEYFDSDGDLEGVSEFQWFRNNIPILNATDQSYTITVADSGQIIKVSVTPISKGDDNAIGIFKSDSINIYYMVDVRDGAEYDYVQIGNQFWMSENLNYHTGDSIGSWCYINTYRVMMGQENNYCDYYGRLYSLNVVMDNESSSKLNQSGIQGICPSGWHIPSLLEWSQLELYITSQVGQHNIGCSIISRYHDIWNCDSERDGFGFSGKFGGGGDSHVGDLIGTNGTWWSSTNSTMLTMDKSGIIKYKVYSSEKETDEYQKNLECRGVNSGGAASLRCIKDVQ